MPTDLELLTESRALRQAGRVDEAHLRMLALVTRGTALWEPYLAAGTAALAKGDRERAVHFLRLAADRESHGTESVQLLSRLLAEDGNDHEALQAWFVRLSHDGSREAIAGFARFVRAWDGPASALESLLNCLPRIPDFRYSEYAKVERQGRLPGAVVVPEEALPPARASFHHMDAPGPTAAAFPAVRRHLVENGVVRPWSEAVVQGNVAYLPDWIDLGEHLLYEAFVGLSTPAADGSMLLLRRESVADWLPEGIVLTSFAVGNWAHFLTETAPILALVEAENLPVHVPLLLARPEARQITEMMERLKHPERPLRVLDRPVQVGQAHWYSPVAQVPFEFLKARAGLPVRYGPGDFLFSPSALAALRERLGLGSSSRGAGRAKVFIDRASSRRKVRNREAVLDFFRGAGFDIIRPESLSLAEQVRLFSRASVVAGQAGAGLANMVFAPAGARIIAFTGHPVDVEPHRYWASMARALGHEFHQIAFGAPSAELHIDFEVALDRLAALRPLLEGGA